METINKSQTYNMLNLFLSFVYVVTGIVLIKDVYHSGVLFPVIVFFLFIFTSVFLSIYDLKYEKKYCSNLLIFLLFHSFALIAFALSIWILSGVRVVTYL